MNRTQLREAVDIHPKVLGWKLDSSDIWVCCDSGNISVTFSAYVKLQAEKEWEAKVARAISTGTDRPDRPPNRITLRHPTLAGECNGLECKHLPLDNVQRSVRVLQRVLDTLQYVEE